MLKSPLIRGIGVGCLFVMVVSAIGIKEVPPKTQALDIGYAQIGVHPQASVETTSTAKRLAALAAYEGKIYAGYGDWSSNTGPVSINPYNPATNSFTGSVLSSSTEAIENFRHINGKLYAPDIDPIAGESSGGYAVAGPSWSHKAPVSATHVFDMVTLNGTDIWMVGSVGRNAAAWRSTNGGTNWSLVKQEAPASTSYFLRYYWVAAYNGKLYLQARASNSSTLLPLQVFDGTNWSTGTTQPFTDRYDYFPENFAGKLLLSSYSVPLSVFDGTTTTKVTSFPGLAMRDIAYSGAYVYVRTTSNYSDSFVVRSKDLVSWERVSAAPSESLSMAVLDGYIYFGGRDGILYRTNTAISDGPMLGDANNDGRVNVLDLSVVITRDGQQYPAADFNGDGTIGAADMAIVLSRWTW